MFKSLAVILALAVVVLAFAMPASATIGAVGGIRTGHYSSYPYGSYGYAPYNSYSYGPYYGRQQYNNYGYYGPSYSGYQQYAGPYGSYGYGPAYGYPYASRA